MSEYVQLQLFDDSDELFAIPEVHATKGSYSPPFDPKLYEQLEFPGYAQYVTNEEDEYHFKIYSAEIIEQIGYPEYCRLFSDVITQIFQDPRISIAQATLSQHIKYLYFGDVKEAGYLKVGRETSAHYFKYYEINIGYNFNLPISGIIEALTLENIESPQEKYLSYKELMKLGKRWRSRGIEVGLFQMAGDPTHLGHLEAISYLKKYFDIVLVGFEHPLLTYKRKSRGNNIQPRLPYQAWKMFEVASLPHVDYVFLLPFTEIDRQSFIKLYHDLNVKGIGCEKYDPIKPKYERDIAAVDGKVYDHYLPRVQSSTALWEYIEGRYGGFLLSTYIKWIEDADKYARSVGYLSDYPGI